MTINFFNNLEPVKFNDSANDSTLAFRHYQPEKLVLGKKYARSICGLPFATGTTSSGQVPIPSARRPFSDHGSATI